jgi:PIN domain nuclease of toxin-antitoxin system
MRLLLDTHVLLWALIEPEQLPAEARAALEAPENGIYFSAANIWEIAIKRSLGRPDFLFEPETIRTAALGIGFEELPIDGTHAAGVRHLPPLHRDPFDRLLIAQAQREPMTLVTNDPLITRYTLSLWQL